MNRDIKILAVQSGISSTHILIGLSFKYFTHILSLIYYVQFILLTSAGDIRLSPLNQNV